VRFALREPKDDGRCIDARCMCGCALKLSSKDFADAARCIAQADPGPYMKLVRAPIAEQARKQEKPEPTKYVECPDCGCEYLMLEYLVDALTSRGSEAPKCGACRGEARQREIDIDSDEYRADGNGS
jgi:hypothetical protein